MFLMLHISFLVLCFHWIFPNGDRQIHKYYFVAVVYIRYLVPCVEICLLRAVGYVCGPSLTDSTPSPSVVVHSVF